MKERIYSVKTNFATALKIMKMTTGVRITVYHMIGVDSKWKRRITLTNQRNRFAPLHRMANLDCVGLLSRPCYVIHNNAGSRL